MARIGKLEVITPVANRRTRVVRLPGHRLGIEHFVSRNWDVVRTDQRSVFVRSRLGRRPTFVKKDLSRNFSSIRLTPTSEVRLALHIRRLRIPRLRVEPPLAILLHPSGRNSAIYRELKGAHHKALERPRWLEEWSYIKQELEKRGIEPADIQWFSHKGRITLFDIEHFTVSEKLKRKLGLRYIEPIWDY